MYLDPAVTYTDIEAQTYFAAAFGGFATSGISNATSDARCI